MQSAVETLQGPAVAGHAVPHAAGGKRSCAQSGRSEGQVKQLVSSFENLLTVQPLATSRGSTSAKPLRSMDDEVLARYRAWKLRRSAQLTAASVGSDTEEAASDCSSSGSLLSSDYAAGDAFSGDGTQNGLHAQEQVIPPPACNRDRQTAGEGDGGEILSSLAVQWGNPPLGSLQAGDGRPGIGPRHGAALHQRRSH